MKLQFQLYCYSSTEKSIHEVVAEHAIQMKEGAYWDLKVC